MGNMYSLKQPRQRDLQGPINHTPPPLRGHWRSRPSRGPRLEFAQVVTGRYYRT